MMLLLACTHSPGTWLVPPGTKKAVWNPGDPIPGWEDTDCGTPSDAGYQAFALPDTRRFGFHIRGAKGVVTEREGSFVVADCEGRGCAKDTSIPHSVAAWANVQVHDQVGGVATRGEGTYGPTLDDPLGAESSGENVLYYWDMGEHAHVHDLAYGQVCLGSVRPDRISGLLTLMPNQELDLVYYNVEMRISFDMALPDGSGVEIDPENPGQPDEEPPEGMGIAYWEYEGVTYDEAWPWDEITDVAVRDAVYERYRPWNAE